MMTSNHGVQKSLELVTGGLWKNLEMEASEALALSVFLVGAEKSRVQGRNVDREHCAFKLSDGNADFPGN